MHNILLELNFGILLFSVLTTLDYCKRAKDGKLSAPVGWKASSILQTYSQALWL